MRIAMGVEYAGTHYSGWQRQDGAHTVQGVVEKAVSQVADSACELICAGRTDAGVHAVEQVVHFDTEAERSSRSWMLGCNANLPGDVNILWAEEVEEDFHARFSALSRTYRYVIYNRKARPSLLCERTTWVYQQLDVEKMHEAALLLQGEHDFTTFRALACQAKSAVRTIKSVEISQSGDFIYLDVTANAFLYHMVRNIAGVLIAIGQHEQPVSWVNDLLQARDRTVGGVTAPASGLYLVSVGYPEQFELPSEGRPPVFG